MSASSAQGVSQSTHVLGLLFAILLFAIASLSLELLSAFLAVLGMDDAWPLCAAVTIAGVVTSGDLFWNMSTRLFHKGD